MRRWLRDTLFLRLFVLMWAALVASHIVAFGVVTSGWLGGFGGGAGANWRSLPTLPSLPPTPGLPDDAARPQRMAPPPPDSRREPPREPLFDRREQPRFESPDGPPEAGGPGGGGPPSQGGPGGPGGPQRPALPTSLLVVDYLIRIVLIGVAAAIGARWLTVPVRRLVDASKALSTSLGSDDRPPVLDEVTGTVEVREAARVFNRMARELDAQFKSRGLLMASLSHDLRTPLTRIRMRLENESEQAFVQRCIDDIRQMNELLDTAFDVFRNAAAEEPAQPVDVQALLQSIADDRIEQGQPVTLQSADGTAGSPTAAVALARPVALRRVVTNLIENALRYGRRADIDVTSDTAGVRIGIDDAGPGIPAHLHEAVFRPFFRVEGSRNRAGGGSGLGLYIARDLTRRQGGELTLRNKAQGGLRAEVVLPRFEAGRSM